MTDLLQIEALLNPITASAFLVLDRVYLLAGEGQVLKVFDYDTHRILLTEQVLTSQTIHGISCLPEAQRLTKSTAIVLIWGGRSVCAVEIRLQYYGDHQPQLRLRKLLPELQLDDWIFDGCLRRCHISGYNVDRNNVSDDCESINAVVVNAHNELLVLNVVPFSAANHGSPNVLYYRIAGPRSILYSAHIGWSIDGRVLVAAGTVFGEILLWSSSTTQNASTTTVRIHFKFTGHEGSVFGVRISERMEGSLIGRHFASCSDDRTIRVWDISNVDYHSASQEEFDTHSPNDDTELRAVHVVRSDRFLAKAMGHASRIWGLRFLAQKDVSQEIMSYGEDSTAQIWLLSPKSDLNGDSGGLDYSLERQVTYSYHSGKNLWAASVLESSFGKFCLATGGADGRIVCYEHSLQEISSIDRTIRCTIEDIFRDAAIPSLKDSLTSATTAASLVEIIYQNLAGQWKLSRDILSQKTSYPSGRLVGDAIFEPRPKNGEPNQVEYLYSESGTFVTEQGLSMTARQNYVYQYDKIEDSLSVWFVKAEDRSTVDYHFQTLQFENASADSHRLRPNAETLSIIAKGYHLCVEDVYKAEYAFRIEGSTVTQWTLTFKVNGPNKDYIATSQYTRQNMSSGSRSLKPNIDPTILASLTCLRKSVVSPSKADAFKTYVWVSKNDCLATTEHGYLLLGTLNTNGKKDADQIEEPFMAWEIVDQHKALMSSCIATSVPSLGVAILTGNDGTILLYSRRSKSLQSVAKMSGKVGFLRAQRLSVFWKENSSVNKKSSVIGAFVAVLGSRICSALIMSLENDASDSLTPQKHCLNLPMNFIVTSSCFVEEEKIVVLGSRSGDLAVYGPLYPSVSLADNGPLGLFKNIHGEETVTSIEIIPQDLSVAGGTFIVTTGRDGKYAIHQLHLDDSEARRPYVRLETVHVSAPPFGPNIEGLHIDANTGNVLLWGFRSKHFMVWNESSKTEVMAVECGGAHRNWAYICHNDSVGAGTFVWTKASVCCLQLQQKASHEVFQYGGHGREIKAIALSPSIRSNAWNESQIVATGAEDTSIRLFQIERSTSQFRCQNVLTQHTTGIQRLVWSPDGERLFSAAGCEELLIWRIQPAPLVTIGVVCEARCPRVTEEGDLRIMDLAVIRNQSAFQENSENEPKYFLTLVYSDSTVRVFEYGISAKENRFTLLADGSYTTYCLTQAMYLNFESNDIYLCTASTDGSVALWPLATALKRHVISDNENQPSDGYQETESTPKLHCSFRAGVHQGSIKVMFVVPISVSQLLLVTGGDDGAIALSRIEVSRFPANSVMRSTLLISEAHASTVSALCSLDTLLEGNVRWHRFASVGNDQRLKTWSIAFDPSKDGEKGIKVMKESNVYTSVADASSLDQGVDIFGQRKLYVAGIGMESWRVGNTDSFGDQIPQSDSGGQKIILEGSLTKG